MTPALLHKWVFSSTAERDAFLRAEFPQRKCSEVPGEYFLPDGRVLSVYLEEVTEWRFV